MAHLLFWKDFTEPNRGRSWDLDRSFTYMNRYIDSINEGVFIEELSEGGQRVYIRGRRTITVEECCVLMRKDAHNLSPITTISPAVFVNRSRKRFRLKLRASSVNSNRIKFKNSWLSLEQIRKAFPKYQSIGSNDIHVPVSGDKGLPSSMIESSHLSGALEKLSMRVKDYFSGGGEWIREKRHYGE